MPIVRTLQNSDDPSLITLKRIYLESIDVDGRVEEAVFDNAIKSQNDQSERWGRFDRVIVLEDDDACRGFAFLRSMPMRDGINCMGYLLYLAVDKDVRNKGYGKLLFKHCCEIFKSDCSKINKIPLALIFEVEDPKLADKLHVETAQKRVRFYEKFGAQVVQDINYIQPPMNSKLPAVPMLLMTLPYPFAELPKNLPIEFYWLAWGLTSNHSLVQRALRIDISELI